jgi:hypothetical protein
VKRNHERIGLAEFFEAFVVQSSSRHLSSLPNSDATSPMPGCTARRVTRSA